MIVLERLLVLWVLTSVPASLFVGSLIGRGKLIGWHGTPRG